MPGLIKRSGLVDGLLIDGLLTDGLIEAGRPLWTPAELSSTAWYDAADTDTITESGGSVSQLDDKSGNDRHVSQTEGSEQPTTGVETIGGLNALGFSLSRLKYDIPVADGMFDGGEDRLIIGVVDYDVTGGFYSYFSNQTAYPDGSFDGNGNSDTNTLEFQFAKSTANKSQIFGQDGGDNSKMGLPSSLNSATGTSILSALSTRSGTNNAVTVWLNGDGENSATSAGAGSDFDATTFVIGGHGSTLTDQPSRFLHGALGEVVVTSDISVESRQRIEGYLAHKWSLTALLPANHPYKNLPPYK